MLLPILILAQVAVISHRGEHLAHPENTIPAFQSAIEAGADFFEADVRTTSDGRFVLMHDATVDRTTNGSGAVRDMTFARIRSLDAGGAQVPTLEEALTLAHGKIGVYVDSKAIAPEGLVAALEKTGMSAHVVIYGGVEFLQKVKALRPGLRVMPEAGDPVRLARIIDVLNPPVAAFDAHDFRDDTIAAAKDAGMKVYVDRLGAADNPAAWQDAVDRGADGIQTDHPAQLVQFLREKKLHP
ncbi:MAG TPA: glycerophosphodiester phosphodiesterase family protein [Bryobacteraceae bacterium]|jgi:glycerophosphoryl diester phosphodiesterase|nr:glycerophosphodiester phosphodiesterase family protein [Bryobacteraceae bacterium]